MIFSVEGHIAKIISKEKTQTRRSSGRYEVGKTYAIQPSRTSKAIPDGRILITKKREEKWWPLTWIDEVDAKAEGGYSQAEFEELYEKLHPYWFRRYAYTFKFVEERKKK